MPEVGNSEILISLYIRNSDLSIEKKNGTDRKKAGCALVPPAKISCLPRAEPIANILHF